MASFKYANLPAYQYHLFDPKAIQYKKVPFRNPEIAIEDPQVEDLEPNSADDNDNDEEERHGVVSAITLDEDSGEDFFNVMTIELTRMRVAGPETSTNAVPNEEEVGEKTEDASAGRSEEPDTTDEGVTESSEPPSTEREGDANAADAHADEGVIGKITNRHVCVTRSTDKVGNSSRSPIIPGSGRRR